MSSQETINNALKVLETAAEGLATASPASAQRMAAMAGITSNVPWELVQSCKVNWRTIDTDDGDELVPVLDIIMKGELP